MITACWWGWWGSFELCLLFNGYQMCKTFTVVAEVWWYPWRTLHVFFPPCLLWVYKYVKLNWCLLVTDNFSDMVIWLQCYICLNSMCSVNVNVKYSWVSFRGYYCIIYLFLVLTLAHYLLFYVWFLLWYWLSIKIKMHGKYCGIDTFK